MEIKKARILFTNIFYIYINGVGILIDSGYPVSEKRFMEKIKNFGKIDYLILTHTHFDHAGNAIYLKRMGARIIVHAYEEDWLKRGETPRPPGTDIIGKTVMRFSSLRSFKFPEVEADIVITDTTKINGIKIVHTPGHTPGSVTVVYKDMAFCGDLIMNLTFRPSSHFPIFAHNIGLVKESVEKLKDMGVNMLYPAHGKPVALEDLKL